MEECPICMENLKFNNRKIHTTVCNHKFHEMCLKKVKNGACPCCRAALPQSLSIIISNLKTEIRDVKCAFKMNKKIGEDLISAKNIKILALNADEKMEEKLLSSRLKEMLSNGLGNDLITVLWVSSQEDKIRNIKKAQEEQFIEVVGIKSEYPRMINHYSNLLLNKTKLLDEAQEKKRMGATM
jgi:hypothetical protein